ncbi:MAG: hypothetical protein JNK57_10925 [Planctomycetaceae bacterium]|nr:hypothetical protein [Planctomycetaceae bacterium]
MIEISLTRFLDFTLKSGTPKVTSLQTTKLQSLKQYDPVVDYYKQIRDAIVNHHRKGTPYSQVEAIANSVQNKSKRDNYPLIAAGYKTFRGSKQLKWFKPPNDVWVANGVSVSINPELGLEIKGVPHLIKLYFKAESFRKQEVKAILSLMDTVLQKPNKPMKMGVLDVRNGKLYTDEPPDPKLMALMHGETAAIAAMWPSL